MKRTRSFLKNVLPEGGIVGGIGSRHAPTEPDNFEIEPERYELRSNALHHFNLRRRDFFKVMGAGIAIFTVTANAVTAQESGGHHQNRDQDQPKDISSWLHISDDGIVTVFTGKVEVGQNTRTTLAQSVADELRVPLASVRMVMGDTALTPFDMGTFGSRSTPYMSPLLRRAASAARDLLLAQAAAEWKTTADKLQASEGKITNPATGAAFSYAQLVLLCHKRRTQQTGQQGSCWSRNLASRIRSVAIEYGLCRSARTRRTARPEVGRNFLGA